MKAQNKKNKPHCSVPNCTHDADYRVMLYDVYPTDGELFIEQDIT